MSAYSTLDPAVAGLKAGLDAQTETAIAGEQLAMGIPVFGYAGDSYNRAYKLYADVQKIVLSGDLVTSNKVNGTINGVDYAEVTYATSHLATITAVVNAMKALTGVEAVLDPSDTNNRTILVRTKGATAAATLVVTLGAGQATATITAGYGQVFLGVSQFTQKEAGVYAAQDAVNVLIQGRVWAPASNPSPLVEAYATATGFSNSGQSVGAIFRGTGSIAEVEVKDRKALTYAFSF